MSAQLTKIVCVTGASGFIGGRIAADLALGHTGHRVRAAVRQDISTGFEDPKLRHLALLGRDRIELAQLRDMTSMEEFTAALEGCDALIHVASPISRGGITDEDVEVAVRGTSVALEAAKAAGVKRVVVTSSLAAICGNQMVRNPGHLWCEEDFNDAPGNNYSKSKVLAWKAAADFAEHNPDISVVTIHPGFVLGPLTEGQECSSTNNMMLHVVDGSQVETGMKLHKVGLVDVRDVSEAHIIAVLDQNIPSGSKFILSGKDQFATHELAEFARETHPELVSLIPTKYQDPSVDATTIKPSTNNSRATALLGRDLRSYKCTIDDTVSSFIARGLVKPPL